MSSIFSAWRDQFYLFFEQMKGPIIKTIKYCKSIYFCLLCLRARKYQNLSNLPIVSVGYLMKYSGYNKNEQRENMMQRLVYYLAGKTGVLIQP